MSALVQVGLYLYMPEGGRPLEVRDRRVVRYKGVLYYMDEQEADAKPLQVSWEGMHWLYAGVLRVGRGRCADVCQQHACRLQSGVLAGNKLVLLTPSPIFTTQLHHGSLLLLLLLLQGAVVAFARNGLYQGAAFSDIPDGTYYPAASLFTLPSQTQGATVTFNFGPDFAFPPPEVGAGADCGRSLGTTPPGRCTTLPLNVMNIQIPVFSSSGWAVSHSTRCCGLYMGSHASPQCLAASWGGGALNSCVCGRALS